MSFVTFPCGADMGHIWIDGPNNTRVALPLTCNREIRFPSVIGMYPCDFYGHAYFDERSGLMIAGEAKQTVDKRGCVVNIDEDPA